MLRRLLFTTFLAAGILSSAFGGDDMYGLNATTTPLAVRAEKAQGLLRTWGFVSGEMAEQFRLNDAAGVGEVQQALETLKTKAAVFTPAVGVSSVAEHYMTWVLARNQMLDELDFSDTALRHFFSVNPKQYTCEPTAKVSELIIPNTYVDALDSTAALSEIARRLTGEQFARVAYEVTLKFGIPDTGLKGDITKQAAGAERFELYRRAHVAGGVGGPYKLEDGYLFVQVHKFAADEADWFLFYRDHIVRDYGREWLKKIYADTLTTAAARLKPLVNEVTSVPRASDVAYLVEGHSVTFAEARATLPFLFGDENNVAFWKSIQRQALEVELIHHSDLGRSIRESVDFRQHLKILALIKDAQQRATSVINQEMTTAPIQAWYQDNREQFAETTTVSYTLYRCGSGVGAATTGATTETEPARPGAVCAAILENLKGNPPGVGAPPPKGVVAETMTSQTWASRSREIQVACQNLSPGEWSPVFSIDGDPQALRLDAIDRQTPEAAEIWDDVKMRYEIEKRVQYWRRFAGLQ